jgi:two-component system, sensor histidine kinase and response regulator
MSDLPASAAIDDGAEIARLIQLLHETDQRLEELLAGQVDSVTDRSGRTILLRRAQGHLRSSESAQRWKAAAELAALSLRTELRERQLSNALSAITDFVQIYDRNARLLFVNQPLLDFWGLTLDEVMGKDFHDLSFPAELATKLTNQILRVFANGTIVADETPYTSRSGAAGWYEYIFSPAMGADGAVEFVVASTRDITERKQAENLLRTSEEEFRTLAAAIPQIVWVTGPEGAMSYANSHWLEYTGLTLEQSRDSGWQVAVHAQDMARTSQDWRRAVKAGTTYAGEVRLRRQDGEFRWWLLRGVPLLDQEGAVLKWLGTGTDVHALKETNTELESRVLERTAQLNLARDQAESANQSKSAFLAAMSHEIRTPMNGVIGMIEVLQQSSLQQHQVEMTDLIYDSAFALLQIIEDILDFSKIEAGKLEVNNQPLSIAECMEKVCGILDHLAVKKGVRMTLFIDPALPPLVHADEGRLRQVLINLIGNAIKFSGDLDRPGRVFVRAVLASAPAATGPVTVDFSVVDNGIGIDESDLGHLFKPFAQADASTTRRYGGSGLGLAISDMLVRLMGGSLRVNSTVGIGSTFTTRLGFVPDTRVTVAAVPAPLAGLSCLILGADGQAAADYAVVLAGAGLKVRRSADVDAALRAEAAPDSTVWLVLPDSVADVERWHSAKVGPPKPHAPLVMLGWGRRRLPHLDAPGRVQVDADSLTTTALLRALGLASGLILPAAEHTRARPAKGQHAETRDQAREGGRLILVAEDNETNRVVILKQLALLGYAADVAGDGQQALEHWRTGEYGLVLTDLHMPRMDGYELTRAIREEETEGNRIPIIALTANALRHEELRCLACGMDAYLSKPVLLKQLRATIEARLGAAVLREPASGLHVDITTLIALVGADPADIAEVLHSFSHTAREADAGISVAVAAGNRKEATRLAHQLAGAAVSVGAQLLGTRCNDLQNAAATCTSDSLVALHVALQAELAAVLQFIDEHG